MGGLNLEVFKVSSFCPHFAVPEDPAKCFNCLIQGPRLDGLTTRFATADANHNSAY
jgi:hypothetical protein